MCSSHHYTSTADVPIESVEVDVSSLSHGPLPTPPVPPYDKRREALNLFLDPTPSSCYPVHGKSEIYRWRLAEGPIPVGIITSNFESHKKGLGLVVRNCLNTVLDRFNMNNVGPKFELVDDPCDSAFFVTFGDGHSTRFSSFSPESHPADWYIYVYSGVLTSEDQVKSLEEDMRAETHDAMASPLEKNLIEILTEVMLRVVGVQHNDAEWNETNSGKPNTLDCIREIYSMKEGEDIEGHRIVDISWKVGGRRRREIAMDLYLVSCRKKTAEFQTVLGCQGYTTNSTLASAKPNDSL
ncbi:hypothetical protein F5883DRAFT_594090 [Diaporthe sp. PMI_573]|nr:hypothetical protein F5883DRAFT_594090 [Diaporthaceae sp. PMI_573]